MAGEFFTPTGFHDSPEVKKQVGLAVLAAELNSDNPSPDRVHALRAYVDKYDQTAAQVSQRHAEAIVESRYPETEDC